MALPVDGPALFGAGMVLVSTLVTLVSVRYVWRLARVLRSPAVSSLDEAAAGALVRVEGTVESEDETVSAPFSGREGSVVEASAEERRLSPYGLPWFVTLWETREAVPFGLRTAEASIPVANPVRTVLLAPDDVTAVGFRETPPDRVAEVETETAGLSVSTVWRDPPGFLDSIWRLLSFGTRRYSEAVLEAGDDMTVVGRADADGGLVPLVVSDRSTRRTIVGMGRTAIGGAVIGVGGLLFGLVLLAI